MTGKENAEGTAFCEKENGYSHFCKKEGSVSGRGRFAVSRAGKTNLNLEGLKGITLYNTYDVFHADAHDIELLKKKVLSEVVTDEIYDAIDLSDQTYIAYECLPGQYDQRADSAQQCLMLLNNKSDVVIKSGHIVVMDGTISEQQLAAVRQYLINPVEMREKDLRILTNEEDVTIEPVPVIEGFIGFDTDALQALREKEGLAMTLADLIHVQTYFRDEEKARSDDDRTEGARYILVGSLPAYDF